jgi:hypothetical protein
MLGYRHELAYVEGTWLAFMHWRHGVYVWVPAVSLGVTSREGVWTVFAAWVFVQPLCQLHMAVGVAMAT